MLILIAIGFFSGIISGMGIGGGVILIPALIFIMKLNQHTAQNINLLYFIPTAVIAIIIHIKNNSIEKSAVGKIVIPGIFAAVLGSFLALNLNADILRKMFSVFLFMMGFVEFRKKSE